MQEKTSEIVKCAMGADEIRSLMLDVVSHNGGHLASSLGVVELTIALNQEFDAYKDRIIWDVGHQAYAWKILTGRAEKFSTLRQLGGISGFPNPLESKADAAVAGHAGVALSIAEGYAASRDLRGSNEHIVAVIGDASFSNGTTFEALNNCASLCKKVIVILNDNEMSISKPTGALSRYLGRLISSARYNRVKDNLKKIETSLNSKILYRLIRHIKGFLKRVLISGAYFEQMGLRYMGPIDGHDIVALRTALQVAKREDRPVLLHIVTKKGKGYKPAMENPTQWHGVGPFALDGSAEAVAWGQATLPGKRPSQSWSQTFGDEIVRLAENDLRIVAITAAMKDGTSLNEFAMKFPKRFYDVGISEGHMVSFAAGLAAGGMRPVVSVYSTFLQRAIDQVMHDVCIANLPVVFCVDRAGVVGEDGVTHQGVFDIAMLRALPNLTICQPKDQEELRVLLSEALNRNGPTVIRYPRGVAPEKVEVDSSLENKSIAIWATGDYLQKANDVAKEVNGAVIYARYIKPIDEEKLKECREKGLKIISLENASMIGGLGDTVKADLKFGWPNEFIPHGKVSELEKKYNLDVESIVAKIKKEI